VRAYALVEHGDSQSIDLLRQEDARRALEDILSDEPDWAGVFYVVQPTGYKGAPQSFNLSPPLSLSLTC
jgi:hypothetical protein